MRNHFNGKTIESATCSDLGAQYNGDRPEWIQLRFTDGTTIEIWASLKGIDIDEIETDPMDIGHLHSKGHPR